MKSELVEEVEALRRQVARLTSRETHWAHVFSESQIGLCSLDRELRYLQINDWLAAINGLPAEQHLGRTIMAVLPDVAKGAESELRHVLETGEPIIRGMVQAETAAHRGVKRTYEHSYYPIESDDGTVVGVSCVVEDITERKRAQDELRESEERLQYALDASLEGLWDWDIKSGKVLFSRRWCESLGFDPEEVEGHVSFWKRILHPDDRERTFSVLNDHFEGKTTTYRVENRLKLKSGKYRYNLDRGRVVEWDENGEPTRMVGTDTDITERKQAEEKVRQYQEQLLALASEASFAEERERRRIAQELHDRIGQNLALAQMKLGAIRRSNIAERATAPLDEVRSILDQTIKDVRSLTFELSPPVLYELGFKPAVEWLTEQWQEQHGIACVVEDDHEPKALESEVEVALFQAVRELLVNVSKHARASRAKVTLSRDDGHMLICVEDDGVGFEPSTVGPTGSKILGFGIFSVQDRLDRVDGTLEFESSPGKGTRAYLRAPLKSAGGE